MNTYPIYMGVCRDCKWNGRKRRDGAESVEDAARHNLRTDHTWNVIESVGPHPADGTWKASRTY